MSNEHVFDGRSLHYAAGRPGYAPQAAALLLQALHPGDRVVDVGSGTGIFAAPFLAAGFSVSCVEPNPEMAARARERLSPFPGYHPVSAPAEHTGLPDGCAALVTAASAFHWFDTAAFRAECLRLLTPTGRFAAVFNARRMEPPFTQAQHRLCQALCPGYRSLRHGVERAESALETFFGGSFEKHVFSFPLEYSRSQFLARSLSSSYAPPEGTAACRAYVQELMHLLDVYFPGKERFSLPNETIVFFGRPAKG